MDGQKKDLNVLIGRNIQAAREHAGLTQAELAEMIGIGDKSLSAVERGTTGISFVKLRSICDKLSVTSDSLLFGDHNSQNARDDEIGGLASRMKRMSAEEYCIVKAILLNVIQAFEINHC